MERSLFALCALLLNVVLAGPRQWYGAFGLSDWFRTPATLVRDAERKLNREHRSLKEREWRGALLTSLVLAGSLIAGWFFGWLFRHGLEFAELLVLTAALPVRPTWDRVSQLRKNLYAGNLQAARQALAGTAWRHHALLDEYGLGRAGIELLAVNFSEKIVAPVFWYLLLGLPGLFASKSLALLQETLTQRGGAEGFGKAARSVHYWLHYLPSRLAALLWLAASLFLPWVKLRETAKQIAGGVNGAAPQIVSLLSAAAVLKLTLGGPASIYAQRWIGSGTSRPASSDVKRALYVFALLDLLLFILLGIFL